VSAYIFYEWAVVRAWLAAQQPHLSPEMERLPCGCADTSASFWGRSWCDAHRCTAIKRDGERCTFKGKFDSLCGVHRRDGST
jgi:hypothetical protein